MNEVPDTISNNEAEFVMNSLVENQLRIDGRNLYDLRNLKISFEGNGITQLQMGKTR